MVARRRGFHHPLASWQAARGIASTLSARPRAVLTRLVPNVTVGPVEGATPKRLRVGVVGCGLVAQVMHLHYLRELRDRFEVTAVCDLSPRALAAAADAVPAARRLERWEDLVSEPLHAVLVLTPGSHEPVAVAAAEAGLHVFAEKPLAFSVEEGERMVAAADRAGVRLMVGYMKRYDPAYEELAARLDAAELRFARVTTLESPLEPYVAHYPLERGGLDEGMLAHLLADDERRVTAAIGTDDPIVRRAYRAVLIDSMVHELNAVRGLLGEPTELRFADVWGLPDGITATFAFGDVEAVFAWIDLPGIASYLQELAFYAPAGRSSLVFPSPFLRSMPTRLVLEGGDAGTASAWRTERIVSYDEAFRRELIEFHACVVDEREPRTPGRDALHDLAVCQAIVRSYLDGRPIAYPAEVATRALH
jgi:predicted dehydrogenase